MGSEKGNQDLKSIFVYLLKKKYYIVTFCALCTISIAIYSTFLTPLWQVSGVVRETSVENQMQSPLGTAASILGISINNNSSNSNLPLLRSRNIVERFIVENELVPIIFEDIGGPNFTDEQILYLAVTYFIEHILTINRSPVDGLIYIDLIWKDPYQAYEWNIGLINLANRLIRENELSLAENFYEYLNSELIETNSVELRQTIASMIESQMQTIMLANASADYAFIYVDPPRVPSQRSFPNRTNMVLIAFLASLLSAIVGLLILREFKN